MGKQDWGKMVAKIGASYAAYVQGKAAKAMASVVTGAADQGIAGYMANGMTDQNWLTLARNIRLANGGADVYALGTSLALADVLPNGAGASGFIYGEDSQIVKKGFLPAYKNVPLIEMGNALVPNTINGTPEVVLPDDMIFMLPLGMNRPLKVVLEGNSVSVEKSPYENVDHTYTMTVDVRLGIDLVVGSKFGVLTLA